MKWTVAGVASVAGVMAVVAVAAAYFFNETTLPRAASADAAIQLAPPAQIQPPRGVAAPDSAATAPAWAQPAAAAPQAAASQRAAPVAVNRSPALEAALARLSRMQRAGTTDPAEVAQALRQLEQANGSPVMHGVRLDALRQNLQIADRMKSIAQEVEALSAAKAPQGAEKSAALAARLKELETLNAQLRTDIVVQDHVPNPSQP